MDLKAFLQLSCQLVDNHRAKVKIRGYQIDVETTSTGWEISTTICSKGMVPLSLLSSIAMARFSVFEKQGIFLKRDSVSGFLKLIKKTKPLNDFESFEKVTLSFINFCDEWKTLVEDEHLYQDHFSLKEG
jgi:hypothetical protein